MYYCHKHKYAKMEKDPSCPGCFDDAAQKLVARMKIIKVEKCDSECPYFFADGNSFIDCKLSSLELVSATMVNGFPVWCELKDAPQKTVEAQDSATNKQSTP